LVDFIKLDIDLDALFKTPVTPLFPELNILMEEFLELPIKDVGMPMSGTRDAGTKLAELLPLNKYITISPEKMIAISIINPE
jgi:hypothetical protein